MRISDWSSDVCSSDLTGEEVVLHRRRFHEARREDVVVVGVHRGGNFAREAEPERRLRIDLSRVREQRVEPHVGIALDVDRSEEHTSELQSLMRISYAVFCLKKKNKHLSHKHSHTNNKTKTDTQ